MTARLPLYWNSTDNCLQEMSSSMVTEIQNRVVYAYGGDPSVTVSQVSSSGNISSGMNDTRLQAGASVTRVDRFATESETG